jgi:REP element-mobilizing transposase RayT
MARRKRWLAPWKDSQVKPVFYHCITRVVDRRFAFGQDEKEKFRTFMRLYENFSGCRVLAYCLMSNHVHILLEVPPMPEGGFSDEDLLRRLRALYSQAVVAEVAEKLAEARRAVAEGMMKESTVAEIHARYTYRMHNLSEFMKGLLQRFTQWFNRTQQRTGNLWEDAFKSVLVEDGVAARAMAAYIDLNPVRAGMVEDPAEYRWSSYGEAIGGGPRGDGKKARAGLVRALLAHQGAEADAQHWAGKVSRNYRLLLLEKGEEKVAAAVDEDGAAGVKVVRKGIKPATAAAERERLLRGQDVALGQVIHQRVRYFSDGVIIGSRGFVNEAFALMRERFGPKRKDGARKLRGAASPAAEWLWSLRDLRKNIVTQET